jgi:hypothetical protein
VTAVKFLTILGKGGIMGKNLYTIIDGEVHPFNCYRDYTEIDALAAYANTEEHAMELATMYERGEIEPTDFHCKKCGGIHMVLQETGE